jgi:hypothetical protein
MSRTRVNRSPLPKSLLLLMAAGAMLAACATAPVAAGTKTTSRTAATRTTTGTAPNTVTGTATGSVPGSGGFSHEVPIALGPGRVISTTDPLRIMLIGDSVMYVAAPAIASELDSTGVVRVYPRALPGWGLTTAGNWRTELPLLISQLHPDLVIGMWSWDDNEALEHPRAYRAMLGQAIDLMITPGDGVAGVMFMQFPPLGPLPPYMKDAKARDAHRDAGVAAWNAIAKSMASIHPGRVMYFPVAGAVELDGKFTPWLPPMNEVQSPRSQWVRVRMVDNVHLCPAGASRYAAALTADLTALYRLPPPSPGWQAGPWTLDHRYSNPPGSCPDDHPPA